MSQPIDIEKIRYLCKKIKREGVNRIISDLQPKLKEQNKMLLPKFITNVVY